MNYIISYPRSGNHWVRFILEFISNRPTLGCKLNPLDLPIHTNEFKNGDNPIIIKNEVPIGRKEHSIGDIDLTDNSKMVLIIRDYKECIIRHNNIITDQTINAYFNLIKLYDDFKGDKMVCYYEDLLNKPDVVADELFHFFKCEDIDRLNDFKQNHERYAKLNKNPVKRQWQGSISGENLNFHKNKYKHNNLDKINNYINNNYIELKNKYIK